MIIILLIIIIVVIVITIIIVTRIHQKRANQNLNELLDCLNNVDISFDEALNELDNLLNKKKKNE